MIPHKVDEVPNCFESMATHSLILMASYSSLVCLGVCESYFGPRNLSAELSRPELELHLHVTRSSCTGGRAGGLVSLAAAWRGTEGPLTRRS